VVRNYTRDEGGPFGFGRQGLIPSYRKLLWSKAMVVSVAEKSGRRSRQARLREASASEPLLKCRKRIRRCQNRGVTLPPGLVRGLSCSLLERHPACRWREAQPGFRMERENLTGDAKGKGASGDHREAESTDAPERGELPRSSDEGPVMGLERRGQVIAVEPGPTGYAGRSPIV
jgi:hypothetical protein